jgi:RimJ/RimL family protein N-acetyltransferase
VAKKTAKKTTAAKKAAAHGVSLPAKGKAAEAVALKRHVELGMSPPASQFAEAIVLRDGSPALVRAIRADDREPLQTAFRALDPESVYMRYFVYKRELTEADLARLCNPDFCERVVLVVTVGADADEVIVGSGGYVAHATDDGSRVAELAFLVAGRVQGQGIARTLLGVLADIARHDGFERLSAEVLVQNTPMFAVFEGSGLPMTRLREEGGVVSLTLSLLNPAGAADTSR